MFTIIPAHHELLDIFCMYFSFYFRCLIYSLIFYALLCKLVPCACASGVVRLARHTILGSSCQLRFLVYIGLLACLLLPEGYLGYLVASPMGIEDAFPGSK
jgi:hypothetical protein